MSLGDAEILRERAKAFLQNSLSLYDQGQYDLAAFNLEQYCQLMVKHKLLIKVGTYPRTHSLMILLRELSKLSEEISSSLNDGRSVAYLTKIEDAYINSRYMPRRYERLEVKEMIDFVREVFMSQIERV